MSWSGDNRSWARCALCFPPDLLRVATIYCGLLRSVAIFEKFQFNLRSITVRSSRSTQPLLTQHDSCTPPRLFVGYVRFQCWNVQFRQTPFFKPCCLIPLMRSVDLMCLKLYTSTRHGAQYTIMHREKVPCQTTTQFQNQLHACPDYCVRVIVFSGGPTRCYLSMYLGSSRSLVEYGVLGTNPRNSVLSV